MRQLCNKSVLFLYGIGAFLFIQPDYISIVACLCAIITTSSCYYLTSGKSCVWVTSFYSFLSCIFPEFCFFLPLILYDSVTYRVYGTYILSAIACVRFFFENPAQPGIFILLGSAISLLLKYQTASYEKLKNEFETTRDDSTELTLLLKEKNQTLLKNQDYEIYTATLKERNRIAREIHDNVGHMLSRSLLMTGALKAVHKNEAIADSLEQLSDTLSTAMDSIRESVHDIHNDSIDLKETLQNIVTDFAFCEISMDYDMGYDIPKEVKFSFISIMKEALSNIIKHSNASAVSIIVREHPALYQLIITDNGTCFSDNSTSGIGLENMKERVASLHGNLQIRTDNGFRIFITVPKA